MVLELSVCVCVCARAPARVTRSTADSFIRLSDKIYYYARDDKSDSLLLFVQMRASQAFLISVQLHLIDESSKE